MRRSPSLLGHGRQLGRSAEEVAAVLTSWRCWSLPAQAPVDVALTSPPAGAAPRLAQQLRLGNCSQFSDEIISNSHWAFLDIYKNIHGLLIQQGVNRTLGIITETTN